MPVGVAQDVDVVDPRTAIELWNQLGPLSKLGLFAQAATCGLVASSIWRPSKPLAIAALITAILGFFGLSLVGIGEAEYTIYGALDPPRWCRPPSVGGQF